MMKSVMDEKEQREEEVIKQKEENKKKYINLFISEEIQFSIEFPKREIKSHLCEYTFRCYICKEPLKTKLVKLGNDHKNLNVEYKCPNQHYGSLDIELFMEHFPSFSLIQQKCLKCRKNQKELNEFLYYCKDCEEFYCQEHIKNCRINKEKYISCEDLDFLCLEHKKDYSSFCEKCCMNLCDICAESHKEHEKYFLKDKLLKKENCDAIKSANESGKDAAIKFKIEIEKFNDLQKSYNKDTENIKNETDESLKLFECVNSFYLYLIKSYNFSLEKKRYNYQIIGSMEEIVLEEFYSLLGNCFMDVKNSIQKLNTSYIFHQNNISKLTAINGIKIKDQKIQNINNKIKFNIGIEPINTNNNEKFIKKHVFEDGEYSGDILDGLPHGNGAYVYKTGEKYIGEFKNGKRFGFGKCTYKNGEEFDGVWKENKKNGQGTYKFSNGDFYKGEFKDDMFDGKGKMFYSNGDNTIGNWKNNKRNGKEYYLNNKGEIFYRSYENNTKILEKKLDSSILNKEFKDKSNSEEILEYLYQNDSKPDKKI